MDDKRKRTRLIVSFSLIVFILCATFRGCSSAITQSRNKKKAQSSNPNRFGSSAVFQVWGNVYPDGYYYVTLNVGNPAKPYHLDIDTGSDLTWLQCDAPCVHCFKAPHPPYKPKNNVVFCKDPLCASIYSSKSQPCKKPTDQCDYGVEYADQGSSLGVLVKDAFPLRFTNGSLFGPPLVFGCGYDQQISSSHPFTDGVLGLGNGKISIVSQLRDMGLTRNVFGHCLSSQGGGFLFFGDDLVPSQRIVWMPMSPNSLEKHYSSGPAELLFGQQSTGLKGLYMVFDSGSSYTYFSSLAYKSTLSLLTNDLVGKPLKVANDDHTLPICWKAAKPLKSVQDVKNYFKPLALSFTNIQSVPLELPPEAYLIISEHGNVCFGILNGTEAGLGNFNLIGDISMQDKMVVYDLERQQIGWAPANCKIPPKS